MALVDGFGRRHDDLRVSVTDRCNLRCTYCMPEEPEWFPRERILTFEEIERLVRMLVGAGVRKLRITGGEPLVRSGIETLVAMLAAVEGIEDLSLTTNGLLLERMAMPLRRAGLRRLNVSLDTFRRDRFRELTRRDRLGKVLAGLDAAREAGFAPIKLNTVLIPGVNDDEVEEIVERGRGEGYEVRFIEFMPLSNGTWDAARVLSGDEVRKSIDARWPLEPDPAGDPHAPATRFLFRDGQGAVGFINSVTAPFCGNCSRLRLTSDGHFRVCIYDHNEIDLKTPLRAGEPDEALLARVEGALAGKSRGGALEILEKKAALPLVRTMHQIGG